MDIYKQKLTKLQRELFTFLCMNTGKSFNQRQLSKKLNVSPTAISKSLDKLTPLIKVEKDPSTKILSIQLNRDKAVNLKRVENLRLLYESNLVMNLKENFPGSTIILFGSYSRGEDTYDSDIDIAIINSKEKRVNLEEYENKLKKDISLNYYEDISKIDKNLKSNLFNGIVLSGAIDI